MERALKYELSKIQDIQEKIFPLHAPEGMNSPYLCYSIKRNVIKDLNGPTGDIQCNIMLNILCETYEKMKEVTKKVEELINTFQFRKLAWGPYVEEISIDIIDEAFEYELKLNRGIIIFKMFYKEE